MPKRGSNIYKRKDGRWEARYEKGRDPDGSIVYGYCYGKTYREVNQKQTEAKLAVSAGQLTAPKKSAVTVSSVCEEWLAKQKFVLKQSSIAKYDIIIKKHIKPELGRYRLAYLTSEICDSFKAGLSESLSVQTVRDVLSVLRAIISYASVSYPGIVKEIRITLPKQEHEEIRVLSVEEQQRFTAFLLENLNDCNFGILLAVLTGMRIGEVCALRWGDVSFENKALNIRATMQRLTCFNGENGAKTEVVIGTPKSTKSLRTIPLTEEALKLCACTGPHEPDTFVLTGTAGFMEPRILQYHLKKITNACGLEGVHFHTLRHTFATRCIEVGFELKSLSEILGHSNTRITLDRYVHSSMKLKRENMEKLTILNNKQ